MKLPGRNQFIAILIAGIVAESLFELYAWFVSPVLFGLALQPSKLVMAIADITTGIDLPHSVAFPVHALIGSVGFATAVHVVKQVGRLSYPVAGAATGFLLWFVAQGVLAPFVGRPFMMEFGAYTQSSFIGHVGMTMVAALIMQRLLRDADGRVPLARW